MAKTEGEQNVPSELAYLYEGTLQYAKIPWSKVCKRYPWSIGSIYANRRGFSKAQMAQRDIFKSAVECYNCQPYTGGKTPPGYGARNRSWWYDAALGSGLWYYDYFIQQTINAIIADETTYWCRATLDGFQQVVELHPDTVYSTYSLPNVEYWQGNSKWIYIMKSPYTFPTLAAFVMDVQGQYPKCGYLTVQIWETLQPWNKTTLSWNNRPPEGSLLSSYSFAPDPGYGLRYIPLPATKDNVCLKVIPSDDTYGIVFNAGSIPHDIPRPYMIADIKN